MPHDGLPHSHSHEHEPPAGAVDWKLHGVKVIPASSLDTNTAQTPGMNRAAAINLARVGTQKIWAGCCPRTSSGAIQTLDPSVW